MSNSDKDNLLEKIVSLAKRRGFVFQDAEIYGGSAGLYDLGPLGAEMAYNIKELWWKRFVSSRPDIYGISSTVIMPERVWEASGHLSGFSDPMAECSKCGHKARVDHWLHDQKSDFFDLVEEIKSEGANQRLVKWNIENSITGDPDWWIKETLDDLKNRSNNVSELFNYIKRKDKRFVCLECGGEMKDSTQFNLMFPVKLGASEDAGTGYLRGELAQGMFANFKNVLDTMRPRLPFGIAQVGRAFRNEIAPRDFLFRVREFEIMEFEYFVRESEWEKHFEFWKDEMWKWIEDVGIDKDKTSELEVPENDRAHYSKRTVDFEFEYPFGKKELYGLAYRTDHDLKNHMEASGIDLRYDDPETSEKFIPHVVEPSFGVGRTLLAILSSAYREDEMNGETRTYLKLNKNIAPIKAAVFPLMKNKPELVSKAREVFEMIRKEIPQVMFDDNGNVGKRYRRQDEIGTPHCITIDFDTLEDDTVTLRDRDTGEQERVAISELLSKLR